MIKVRNFPRFKYFLNGKRKFIFFGLLLFSFQFSVFSSSALAQTDEPKDSEPPPLKMISKEEKSQLEAVSEIKNRTTLALTLMDSHLKKAEEFYSQEDYAKMFDELGGFHALIDNTLDFLNRRDDGSRKVLNNFKKLELSLRSFLNRLELIRREVPTKYEFYVRGLVKTVRDARTRAVEPLFSDTVVPNKRTDN